MGAIEWAVMAVVVFAVGGLQFRTWLARRRKTYQDVLAPELRAHGLEFISAVTPKPFDVGPFPKFEIEIGGYSHSRGPTGSGHYQQYRIVRVRDKAGQEREVWARLRFEFWNLKHVEWSPDLRTFGPKDSPAV